jgi:hypothetical protein
MVQKLPWLPGSFKSIAAQQQNNLDDTSRTPNRMELDSGVKEHVGI